MELGTARAAAAGSVAALERDLAALMAAAIGANGDDEHDPEGATIGFERAQLTVLLASARHRLAELDAALERVDAGTYGTCVRCGRPIGAERLAARPAATTCVGCA